MAKNNLTIFQKLGQILGPDGFKIKQTQQQTQRYKMNNDVLLKTTDKKEYEIAKLQAQQNKYLGQVWKKVEHGLFQQAVNYETTRIGSYSDFEAMEFYPEIAAALDIFMEESTTLNNNGRMVNVYSDSKRVKGIIEDLLFNRLDIHTSLPMWTRNTVKYGDNFVFLHIDEKNGIVGAKQMPNYEMERRDGALYDILTQRMNEDYKADKVKFYWRGRDVEFNSWQIAHFRIFGDDRRLPYGTSLLEKARRIWKQLLLSEDAMLVYRVTRAPERRIYKIYVGNIDDKDVESYVNEIANRFKRTPMVDPQTGQVDLRYNQLPVWKNTPIPLLDGRTLTIEELAKEYDEGKENWVHSINDKTHQLVGGKVKWCGKNYTAEKMIKIWLDDNTHITTAPEHPFILRDGSHKRADELKENDSLMPFYRDEKAFTTTPNASKYYRVFNPKTGKYEFTHRFVAKEISNLGENNNTIHHIDFNSKNNNPENLLWTNWHEHQNYHKELMKTKWKNGLYNKVVPKLIEYNKSEKKRIRNIELAKEQDWASTFIEYNHSDLHTQHNILRKDAQLKDWSNPEKKKVRSKAMQIKFDSIIWELIRKNIINKKIKNRKTLVEFLNEDEQLNHIISINTNRRLHRQRKIERTVIERLLIEEGFETITDYINSHSKNHKVKSIEIVGGDDVYCMTVVGPNGENDRHNFAALSLDYENNVSVSGSFLRNSNDQDYFIPVRTEDAPSPIDTLPGACLALNTRIPLLDGRILELQEIIKEWDNGNKNMWVYSVNPNTGESTIGPITWAGITRKNTQVLKITLDNGKEVIATPDHKFVHRTNGFVEAQHLNIGDSLMPFYSDTAKIKSNTNGEYHRTWDSNKQEWIFTHRLVTDKLDKFGLIKEFIFDEKYSDSDKKIRHHRDHNRFNNNPDNIVWMNGGDHMRYHQSVIKETIWANPELNKEKITNGINKYISNLTKEEKIFRANNSKNNSIKSRNKAKKTFDDNPNKNDIISLRGKAISNVKSTLEFKEKFSKIASEQWKKEGYKKRVFSKNQNIIFSDKLYDMFLGEYNKLGRADLTLSVLNSNETFINEFRSNNTNIRSALTNLNEFTHNHLEKMLKQRGFKNYRQWCKITAEELGYKNVRAWKYYIEKENKIELYNHKIINIEWLDDTQDTGTITVDGEEKFNKNHTFALESGIYVKNSNLDQIADIEYLQKKLFTALRVPKPFLGFDETTGEGKNLALQDIRFSRTINRIQQSMLQELNKVIIIHLYLLGFEDELDNFTITLNNPSTQAEMLKVEHMQLKVTLYKDAVSDAGNGFGAMSMTRARREIFGWPDNEIKQDLLEQRMEKAAAAELANSASVIKHTGMFDTVDRIYGDMNKALEGGTGGTEEGKEPSGGFSGGGGGFGGGGTTEADLNFGAEGTEETEGAEAAGAGGPEAGAAEAGGPEAGAAEAAGAEKPETEAPPTAENIKKIENLLKEEKEKISKKLNERTEKYKGLFVNKLIEMVDNEPKPIEKVKIYDKNVHINESVNTMIREIDDMLESE
jgi:hypothetical protein